MTHFWTSALVMAKELGSDVVQNIKNNPDKTYFPFFGDSENIFNSGITIDRVFFTIPGTDFKIYWYGFLIALGIILALFYGYRKMPSSGLNPDKITDAIIGGLIGAIFGARLYYVIFNEVGVGFKDFFDTRSGGLAIYGGLIGAVLVGGTIVILHKQNLWATLDVAAPCFLIGQCIGRWGNFFNQEAFGTNTTLPWGMMSSKTISYLASVCDDYALRTGETIDYYLPVHPCFLYESIWCLVGFIMLHFYFKNRRFDGEIFLMYIGWYGLGRFFIEGLRTDSLYLGNIRVSQLVAGTCVLASLVLIIIFRGSVKRSGGRKLYYETKDSEIGLAAYMCDVEYTNRKAELRKKIAAAKAEEKDFSALQKEYDNSYGADGKKNHAEKLAKLKAEAKEYFSKKKAQENKSDEMAGEENYESILGDDENNTEEVPDNDTAEGGTVENDAKEDE